MKTSLLFLSILLFLFSGCSRDFDPLTADDILIDEYDEIRTLPDPYLNNLVLTNQAGGGSAITLLPNFDRNITNYEAIVFNTMDQINFIGTTSHSNAFIVVDGETNTSGTISHPVTLTNGTNIIHLDVYAQDKLTKRTYTVRVARVTGSGSSNNYLTGLTTSPSNISSFASNTLEYEITTSYFVTNTTITPTAGHPAAKIWINGVPVTSGNSREVTSAVGTNTNIIRVQAEDYTVRNYIVRIIRELAPPSPITSLFITEWGDAGTGVDFIELKNFGYGTVTVTTDLGIIYNGAQVNITQWFTGTNISSPSAIGTGVPINPGEVFLIVESDTTAVNMTTIEGWGMPLTCKVFISDETTLMGSGDRLDDGFVILTNNDSAAGWCQTPDPVAFGSSVGTSTFSVLSNGFDPSTDSSTDINWWQNSGAGSVDDEFRTPGMWP